MHDDIALFRSDSELRQLVQSFEGCTLVHECWTHRAHVSVGAWYTLRLGDQAIDRIRDGILALNRSHGVETTPTRGYHESITVAWSRLIADELRRLDPSLPDYVKVNAVATALSDKTKLLEYYARDTLMSMEARYGWVEPDLRPLP